MGGKITSGVFYSKNFNFQYNDTWGTLCSNTTWDRYTASALCLSMGFGYGAARLVALDMSNITLFWEDAVHSKVRYTVESSEEWILLFLTCCTSLILKPIPGKDASGLVG